MGGDPRGEISVPVRLFDVSLGKEVKQFPLREPLDAIALSFDARYVVTVLDDKIQVWDIRTSKEFRQFNGQKDQLNFIKSIGISRDGKYLASVGVRPSVCVWDIGTGERRWQIFGWNSLAVAVDFSPNGRMIAFGIEDGSVVLLDAASGRERARFHGPKDIVASVAFSPCGLMLGSAGQNCAPLIWDVTGQILAATKPAAPLSAKELDACWAEMGGEVAGKTWQAICALTIREDQAVRFLKRHLPNQRFEPKRQAQLQADLEIGDFAARERAVKDLAEIGPPALPFLRKLAASGINADAKKRIENLLGQPGKSGLLTEEARCRYAIEVLEYVGTPQAKELLLAQSQGEPASLVTQDAKSALSRLRKLPPSPP
jgi:hypothetical protein